LIIVDQISKRFKGKGIDVLAIDNTSFEVAQGKFFTLLGPSGCGKTTTMRCIAGLERPDSGRIRIGETTVFDRKKRVYVPTAKRPIAMVFQSYAIWPHMNVFDNVAYPLRAKHVNRQDVRSRVNEALAMVDLESQANRPAPQLSGGQQQRVALARALVARPDVLILDEPLSNLDASLRGQMRVEMKRLQSTLQLTTVYVTHDQQEALSMSDEIAVMRSGKLMQYGTPDEIYHRPAGRFVAEFVGATNLIPGSSRDALHGDVARVETALGTIAAGVSEGAIGRSGEMMVSIRPEAVSLSPASGNGDPEGVIEQVMFLGESFDYMVRSNDSLLRVRRPSTEPMSSVGEHVSIQFTAKGCAVIPPTDDDPTEADSDDGPVSAMASAGADDRPNKEST
jgi:iron(III) transport system ATP-binding protein